jgi:hypothetical protein
MTRASCLLVCGALLVACQSSDAPTAPATPTITSPLAATVVRTRQRIPVVADAVVLNECTGELVQFHFNQLMITQDLEIVGRAFHSHIVSVDRGSTGVGLTTGTRYRQVGSQGGSFFISAKIDEVQTFVTRGNVIAQGSTADFRNHSTYHITVGPTGRVVVEFDKARFTCR